MNHRRARRGDYGGSKLGGTLGTVRLHPPGRHLSPPARSQPGPGSTDGRPLRDQRDTRATPSTPHPPSALPLCLWVPPWRTLPALAPEHWEMPLPRTGKLQGFPRACPPGRLTDAPSARPADQSLDCPPLLGSSQRLPAALRTALWLPRSTDMTCGAWLPATRQF